MSDDLLADAVQAAFAGYLASVAILGAISKTAIADGRVVKLHPDPAAAQQFSDYPIPESITVERPA